ncbi:MULTISPECIES: DUF4865 family protein [Streptomyces]|uniref:DUF4865 family protein n=1 Tax=Streptomyces TaxID=1883 RepID=UPI001A93DBB3|nr:MULTISPECIES: DUF4865 family protein [Streptomyces]MBO0914153.1 DUF4865 family protein [Streptomyces laculatispora]MCX4774536.1 DUF4865 family protein [Streptomyces sp. NBC_01285]
MHAMQYEITLPADYDMGIIRDRVAAKGHLLDDFPGLGVKAYLIRERGEDSPVNQYAPFYLWSAPEGMNSFLWGPGFQGIVRDFGRPEVQHWAGLAYEEGPSSAALPRTATRRRAPVPASAAPADVVDAALEESSRLAKAPGAVATALAVDPRRWELVHFTLWDHLAPKEPGERFEVLHLSQPGRGDLGQGRQW